MRMVQLYSSVEAEQLCLPRSFLFSPCTPTLSVLDKVHVNLDMDMLTDDLLETARAACLLSVCCVTASIGVIGVTTDADEVQATFLYVWCSFWVT